MTWGGGWGGGGPRDPLSPLVSIAVFTRNVTSESATEDGGGEDFFFRHRRRTHSLKFGPD